MEQNQLHYRNQMICRQGYSLPSAYRRDRRQRHILPSVAVGKEPLSANFSKGWRQRQTVGKERFAVSLHATDGKEYAFAVCFRTYWRQRSGHVALWRGLNEITSLPSAYKLYWRQTSYFAVCLQAPLTANLLTVKKKRNPPGRWLCRL